MKKITSAVVGFIVAPLIAAVSGAILTPIGPGLDVISILGLIPIFYLFSVLAAAFLGMPAFLLLLHFGLINFWSAVGTGIIAGVLVAVVLRLPNAVSIHDALVMASMGAVSAIGFWLIWICGHDSHEATT